MNLSPKQILGAKIATGVVLIAVGAYLGYKVHKELKTVIAELREEKAGLVDDVQEYERVVENMSNQIKHFREEEKKAKEQIRAAFEDDIDTSGEEPVTIVNPELQEMRERYKKGPRIVDQEAEQRFVDKYVNVPKVNNHHGSEDLSHLTPSERIRRKRELEHEQADLNDLPY